MVDDLLDRLAAAVSLESDDVAIRVAAEYQPQAGPDAKISPPTYIQDSEGSRYHLEERWGADGEKVSVVMVDSIQSQANRAEQALKPVAQELGLPQLVLRAEAAGMTITVSNLDAPHRSRDAYFVDSELDGQPFDKTEVGEALARATSEDATAHLRHAPYDLVYGVWDSHRGKRLPTKFPRVVTSEMLGWDVLRGKRGATKTDPLNMPGEDKVSTQEWRGESTAKQRKKESPLNEIGYGMIPVAASDEAGGVSVKAITRSAVISLTGLAALRFPGAGENVDVPGRVALAALALLADRLAFGRAGLNLRSGCELVRSSERLEWVRAGGEAEPLDLNVDDARALLAGARERLEAAGLAWDPEPVELRPSERLRPFIERTFYVPELDLAE